MWITIKVFIKGMIMGAVNVFPVSSGTVSLILGVFERFVNAIKSLNHKNFKFLRKGQFGDFVQRTDFKFLLTIFAGIMMGMVLTAIFLKQTLKSYEVFTWSFFIGLIMASVVYVMKRIETQRRSSQRRPMPPQLRVVSSIPPLHFTCVYFIISR